MQGAVDPYAVPKSMGIFRMIESPKDITTTSVAQRIVVNHEIYQVYIYSLFSLLHVCYKVSSQLSGFLTFLHELAVTLAFSHAKKKSEF